MALSYVAPDERTYIRDIERLTKVKLTALPLPEDFLKLAASLPAPKKVDPGEAGADRETRGDQRRDGRRGQGGGGGRQGGQRPQGERSERPEGEARPKRRFRPRGPKGLGQHAGKVRRVG